MARRRSWMVVAGSIAALILPLTAAYLAGASWVAGARAEAQEAPEEAVQVDAVTAYFNCATLLDLASWSGASARIHIGCATPNAGITWYAYASDAANAVTADQMLALGTTALALGKPIRLYYNSDPALNPPGCGAADCRGLTGVQVLQ